MKFPKQEKLTREIFAITALIQKKYPAQYRLLGETPLFLFDAAGEIEPIDFEHYLESLKTQLASFEQESIYPKTCE